VGPAGAFAFSKAKPKARYSAPTASVSRHNRDSRISPQPLPFPTHVAAVTLPVPASEPVVAPLKDSASLLATASELGDAGQLEEALKLCNEYLQRTPGSVKGHYLFGVLQDALGYPDLAAGAFRKVLYLDPSHRGALLHLALKREALGDSSGAALLRARARRAPEADAAE
jgi:chemotaxis protein methyltransferase WspC